MPSIEDPEAATRINRRARVAVSLLFLSNGAVYANLIPRLPTVKSDLGLTNAQYGIAIAAGSIGALASGLLAGVLIRRFRSSRVAVVGMIASAACVVLAGAAPGWAVLAAALFLAGAMDSVVDVSQNSHGLRVQRRYGRSILNSFHAIWSVGALLGGLMGGAAAALDLPLPLHLAISGAILAGVNVVSYRFLLPGPEPVEVARAVDPATGGPGSRNAVRLGTWGALLALGLIAISGSIVEDSGNTWAAVYLSGTLGAGAAVAAAGFIALAGMQFVGRIIGDRLVDRFGQRAVARAGGAIVAIGMGTALALPTVPGTVIGFGLAGFGVATLVPAAMHTADELPGFRAGTGLSLLSWMMRLGFLLSPPVVGLVADSHGLRWGLVIVPVAGVLVVLLAAVLPRRRGPEVPAEAPAT